MLAETAASQGGQQAEGQERCEYLTRPLVTERLVALGCNIEYSAIVGLVLSRWWQALLYNPGGFERGVPQPEGLSPKLRVAVGLIVGLYAAGLVSARWYLSGYGLS